MIPQADEALDHGLRALDQASADLFLLVGERGVANSFDAIMDFIERCDTLVDPKAEQSFDLRMQARRYESYWSRVLYLHREAKPDLLPPWQPGSHVRSRSGGTKLKEDQDTPGQRLPENAGPHFATAAEAEAWLAEGLTSGRLAGVTEDAALGIEAFTTGIRDALSNRPARKTIVAEAVRRWCASASGREPDAASCERVFAVLRQHEVILPRVFRCVVGILENGLAGHLPLTRAVGDYLDWGLLRSPELAREPSVHRIGLVFDIHLTDGGLPPADRLAFLRTACLISEALYVERLDDLDRQLQYVIRLPEIAGHSRGASSAGLVKAGAGYWRGIRKILGAMHDPALADLNAINRRLNLFRRAQSPAPAGLREPEQPVWLAESAASLGESMARRLVHLFGELLKTDDLTGLADLLERMWAAARNDRAGRRELAKSAVDILGRWPELAGDREHGERDVVIQQLLAMSSSIRMLKIHVIRTSSWSLHPVLVNISSDSRTLRNMPGSEIALAPEVERAGITQYVKSFENKKFPETLRELLLRKTNITSNVNFGDQ